MQEQTESFSKPGWQRDWLIVRSLVKKDFKLKYRGSVLGCLWSVLTPLLMMCVLTAVFSAFFKFEIEYYPIYLILGNVLFSLMGDSTTSAMNSILDSASLIKKIRIKKIIFPLERVLFQFVNFLFSLLAVVMVIAFFQIAPTANILFLPLLLFYVALLSAGLGMMLAALAVFFTDIVQLWKVIILAWTYATPIFYPVSILPDWMLVAEEFNPMYHMITYFREIVLWGQTPSLTENLICLGMGALTFIAGYLVFNKTQSKFILHV